MSKGESGLFNGFNSNAEREKQSQSNKPYKSTKKFKNHIENPEPTTSGNEGIKGAHLK